MTVTVMPRSPQQRQAILGQLPRITRADGSPIRVLLVDDEPALTNLLKMALHYEGWEIDVARDGQQAMAKFAEFGPDLWCSTSCCPTSTVCRSSNRSASPQGYTPDAVPHRA